MSSGRKRAERILRAAGRIVPEHLRASWLRQWGADLAHLEREGVGDRRMLRVAAGSVVHAWSLRREGWTMRGQGKELVQSARALARRPGYALLAVATLAVGIGTVTAIFSLGEALVLRPVPYPDGDRLVRMFSANARTGFSSFSVSHPDYEDVVEGSGLFVSGSFYLDVDQDLSGDGDPQRIRVTRVADGYFQALGARLVLGRPFAEDDHDPARDPTVLLDEALWSARFGSDSSVVGRVVRIDGFPHTVLGVVASGQGWPTTTDAWTPLQWGSTVPEYAAARSNHTWQVIGRLQDDISIGDASTQVRELVRATYAGDDIDERDVGTEAFLLSLRASAGGESASQIFLTLGTAVFLVLMIACMNASGLLLTRALGRSKELAVRAALGAGRARLLIALMGETLLLAMLGGAAGAWLGHQALKLALSAAPPEVAAAADVRLNTTVLIVALGASVVAALLAGLLPALRATRVSVTETLKENTGAASASRASMGLRRSLIVGEIALSLALLVSAGIAVRGFQKQFEADPGFDPDNLIGFTLKLPAARFQEASLVDDFLTRATGELERSASIESAATISQLPLGGPGSSLYRAFIEDGMPAPPDGAEYGALWIEVDPATFRTLGVSPTTGRDFTLDDQADAPLVAIVNRAMADAMAEGDGLVGREIRSFYDENLPRTVVGIVPDLQFNGVARVRRQPIVFVPRTQAARREMAFLVRTRDDPERVLAEVRGLMSGLDADVALADLQTLRDSHAADLAGIRFMTSLFGAFGFLALVLAVSGVYGLVSYSVSQRRHDVGVRMAIGATAGDVRRGILAESGRLAAIGLAVGLGLAYAGARVVAAGMDGIAVLSPTTSGLVTLLLAGAVFMASWIPSARVGRVNPVDALRSD